MILRALQVRGFRNLESVDLSPGPRATVLYGDNGQGKTNLVEAAYFLIAFRSFRAQVTSELLGFGRPTAHLAAELETAGLTRKLTAELVREPAAPGLASHPGRPEVRKLIKLDGKTVSRAAPGLAGLGAVLFVPEDLLLPRAAPAERRRFIDTAIFGADRGYLRIAQEYQKVLRNRNALLRRSGDEGGALDGTLLDTFDEHLARTGAQVVVRRRALVATLAPRVTALFARIHADAEPLRATIAYLDHETLTDAGTAVQLATALHDGLRARRSLDLRRGHSGYGPHNHDLAIKLGGHPAREHGSQGQLRSLVLALKLAELENLSEALGEPPLLLLDDVASELDRERRTRLFEAIAGLPGQSLITITDRDLLPPLPARHDVEIRAGSIVSK